MIPKINIKNKRYGFATNSSSLHSIIHNINNTGVDNIQNEYYGWEFFTLSSKEEKSKYLWAQFVNNFDYIYMKTLKKALIFKGFDEAADFLSGGKIDHQSVQTYPKKTTGELDIDFFKDYHDYIVDLNFQILGGNDNSDGDHKLAKYHDGMETYWEAFTPDDISYKNGNYWVVMNDTRKLRISFHDHNQNLQPKFPELIDLKITDYCDKNCSYCYQGSTSNGVHGSLIDIKKAIQFSCVSMPELRNKPKIEFALGGGEPTEHPYFVEILSEIHFHRGISNFTTKSLNWLDEERKIEAVKKYVSGIAYSIDTYVEFITCLEKHNSVFKQDDKSSPVLYIHLIPEIMSHDDFRKILGAVEDYNSSTSVKYGTYTNKIHVTILGFKSMGRAEKMKREVQPEIVEIFMKLNNTPIGIDTKFAADYQQFLDENNIDRKLYTTEEGVYSMYIDTIEKKAYKSSWQLDNPVDYTNDSWVGIQRITDVFKLIN